MRRMKLLLVLAAAVLARGDVIECDNGDRYNGKVLSMDERQVKLQNEITGTLTIPRSRIVSISFRAGQQPAQLRGAATNGAPVRPLLPGQKSIAIDDASIEQVQRELLSTADPAANQMFQEMVRGLQTGQLNLGDIRVQAQETLKELRELQGDLGDDAATELLDSYAAILENFVGKTPLATNPAPVRPAPPVQPAIPASKQP